MIREFEIAKEQGLILLPIGATGYAAAQIYEILQTEGYFDSEIFPDKAKPELVELNNATASLKSLKDSLLKLLETLN